MPLPSNSPEYPGSVRLNTHVFLLNPTDTGRPNPLHPSLVLLFGWFNAQPPHLYKYIEPLQKMFSTSTIVVVQSDTSMLLRSQSSLEARLAPIVQLLQRETSGSSSHRGVLVHALSNAGGLHIVKLRRVLSRLHESMPATTSGPRIPTALVLDSAPSANLLSLAINIFAPDNPVMHMLSLPPLLVLYVIFSTTVRLSGYPPLLRELRETLNTPGLLPTVTPDTDPAATPRLYIYSDGDRVTPAHEVEAHIGEARARGFEVRVERFDRTSHVAHMREDPARYWRAVNRLWARASSTVPGSPALASL